MSAGVQSPVEQDAFPRLLEAFSGSVRNQLQNAPSTAVLMRAPSVAFRLGKAGALCGLVGCLETHRFVHQKPECLFFPQCLVLNVDLKTAARSGDGPSCRSAGHDWFTGHAGPGAGVLLQEGPDRVGTALVSSSVICFQIPGFWTNSGLASSVSWFKMGQQTGLQARSRQIPPDP